MKGKSGIKDCPRCGLRNRLSAMTCDFCGYQFPRVDEGVEDYIDTLDRLSKETAYRMNDEVSEKIRSTLKSPTDVPVAKKVMEEPEPRIPDSVVATTLVSIPKPEDMVVEEMPARGPDTEAARERHIEIPPETTEGIADIDAPAEPIETGIGKAASEFVEETGEALDEGPVIPGSTIVEVTEVPIEAETVTAEGTEVELDAPEDEVVREETMAIASIAEDRVIEGSALDIQEDLEDRECSAMEDVTVGEDAIAALAAASIAENEETVVLSTPDVDAPGGSTEEVSPDTIVEMVSPNTYVDVEPAPIGTVEPVQEEPLVTTVSDDVEAPRDVSGTSSRAVDRPPVVDRPCRYATYGGLVLLGSGAVIYAGLIGMHAISGDSIAYAWGGGVLGAALMSFGAYILSARLFKGGDAPQASSVPVASSREVVLCPKCYEIVSEDDRNCPACGAEFKDDD